MAGRSPVSANDEQRRALVELGRSRDRAEADRARAILMTLAGWTSPDIAAAFGVREDTVRLWRRDADGEHPRVLARAVAVNRTRLFAAADQLVCLWLVQRQMGAALQVVLCQAGLL